MDEDRVSTLTVVEFLESRIAEDETNAANANDPARALREVAFKRELIADWRIYSDAQYPDFEGGFATAMDSVLDYLSSVYSDHPDYVT